jgi:gamma-glutamylcyclotransferase
VTARLCTFAYGSNMLTARLRGRVLSATPVGIGRLSGHLLKWDKRSSDGSGKCDAEATGRKEDFVWGVLFELNSNEKAALDRAEGLGQGYEERQIEVISDRGPVQAFAYIATTKDPSLRPYDWYKALVVAGAREHGLPEEYVQLLDRIGSVQDPDRARAAKNAKLISD